MTTHFAKVKLFDCPCGRSFETQKGRNAHRGARGTCPAKGIRTADTH